MTRRNQVLLASLVAVTAAGGGALAARAWTLLAPAPARSHLVLDEFMGHVMERNAEQLWAWTAEDIDTKGRRSGQPVDYQGWEDAESDSLSLSQLTYALESSTATGNDGPDWRAHIARLRSAAEASARAAEAHDFPALQKASNAINAACVSCHWRFAPALEMAPKYPGEK